ncbi:MAG: hypothetical protein V9F04_15765 [Dermatophilaceae bacterium]
MASTSTRPRRGIRAVPLAALVTSVALVATGSTLTACTPTKEPSMDQDEAAAVVRAEVRAMAAQLGHGVTDYAEKLVPCETMPAGSTMSFNVSLRLVPDEDRVAQMRAGYLAGKEAQGWRLRDDNTPDHAGLDHPGRPRVQHRLLRLPRQSAGHGRRLGPLPAQGRGHSRDPDLVRDVNLSLGRGRARALRLTP